MSFSEFSIKRPVTVLMFSVAVTLFGLLALTRLSVNLLPDLAYPTLTIRTDYDGAAPQEIEQLITKPIEESLGVIKNVQQMRSISSAGQSDVILSFNWGTDMDFSGLSVREKLDQLTLPLDIKRPRVLRFNPNLDPIIRIALSYQPGGGPLNDAKRQFLRSIAENQVEKKLESQLGVASIQINGGLEREVEVEVDQGQLDRLNITIDQIAQQLAALNVNLASGQLNTQDKRYLVRTINQYQTIQDIENSFIRLPNSPISYRLSDIATVRLGYKERQTLTRINNQESVDIALFKEGDANTVAVAQGVIAEIAKIKKALPQDIVLNITYNQASFIEKAVNLVLDNALQGGLLAIIILFLFLKEIRPTVIVALAIPVSIIATFGMMYSFGISLNIMSLGGIALAVGLLVDNAIVVLENIARYKEQGLPLIEAVKKGANEVSLAILAATLTTICVFLPMVFVEGIAGQLFKDQALTVTFALLVSLVVALTLVPMLASSKKDTGVDDIDAANQPHTKAPDNMLYRNLSMVGVFLFFKVPIFILTGIVIVFKYLARLVSFLVAPLIMLFDFIYNFIKKGYQKILPKALKFQFITLSVTLLIFVGSIELIKQLNIALIPDLSQNEYIIVIKLPQGTPIEVTDQALALLQEKAVNLKEIKTVYSLLGNDGRIRADGDRPGSHRAEINVVIDRNISSIEQQKNKIITTLRSWLKQVPGARYEITQPSLFELPDALEIEIIGFDLQALAQYSNDLVNALQLDSFFTDVRTTTVKGFPELQIEFDDDKVAQLGLTSADIAKQVREKLRGEVATQYNLLNQKVDVRIKVNEKARNSLQQVNNLSIKRDQNNALPLSTVATIKRSDSATDIQRIAQQRVSIVSTNFTEGGLTKAVEKVNQYLKNIPQPAGLTARVAGQNSAIKASFASLQLALILAVFLVYLVMASLFESFLHPFIILVSVPLSVIGVIVALVLSSTALSIVVFIGVIMLVGIVVNNGIVLINRINQLREEGVRKFQAIIEGAYSRFRPILMTSLTTILGLLPLALGVGEGAEIRAPMAIAVIGGLLVSTILTLLVTPVLYQLIDQKRDAVDAVTVESSLR